MTQGHRAAGWLTAALFVSFLLGQGVLIATVPAALDADGQLVRAANIAARFVTGDAGLTDQIGTPSWGVPALEAVAEASPYPPGFPAVWSPVLWATEGATWAIRGWSAVWVVVGMAAVVGAARGLAGAWAGVGVAAAFLGMPVVHALAGSGTIDTLGFASIGLAMAALVHADGFTRRGSGLLVGLVAAAALSVRWTAAPLLLPLTAAALLRVGTARGARVGLGALLLLVAGSVAAFGRAAAGAWSPGAVGAWVPWVAAFGPAGLALVVAGVARRRGEAPLARAALAAAMVLGPGMCWYWLRADAVAFYFASQQRQATAETSWGALVGTWRVLHQLGSGGEVLLPLGLLAALRAPRRVEAVALVATGLLATWGLLRSGSPELFTTGSVGARQLLGPAAFLAVGAGLLVAAAGAWAPRVAALLVVAGLFTQWSFRLPLCAPKPRDVAIYRICERVRPVLAWSAVHPQPGAASRVEDVLAPSPTPRVVAVLTPSRRLWKADEAPYVQALLGRGRAVTVVDLKPAEVEDWLRRWVDRVDDVVFVGLPPVAVPGFGPPAPLDLGPRAPKAVWATGPGRGGQSVDGGLSDPRVGH